MTFLRKFAHALKVAGMGESNNPQLSVASARAVVQSQFHAALDMLRQTVERCPDSLWLATGDKPAFWRVAYHALFFVHLYAQPDAAAFTEWDRHRLDHQQLGPPPWAPDQQPRIGEPYTQHDVGDYIAFCRAQIDAHTASLDPLAPSGFDWLPMNKLELQLYSIRHLQNHVGELSGRLDREANIQVDWVGQKA